MVTFEHSGMSDSSAAAYGPTSYGSTVPQADRMRQKAMASGRIVAPLGWGR